MAELPQSWQECDIGEVAKIVGGGTPKSKDPTNFTEEGGHAWLTPADLSKYNEIYIERGARNITDKGLTTSSARLMPKGTVLFSSRAPIGYVVIASNEISTNQGFKSFICYKGIISEYIYFYLIHAKPLAENLAGGTTFAEISGKNAAKIPLKLPPTNEQKRIAYKLEKMLGKVDSCKEQLDKIPDILKKFRQSVLHQATTGKLTEDWRKDNPDVEPASELLEKILSKRRGNWELDEFNKKKVTGKLPKNDKWKEKYKIPMSFEEVDYEFKVGLPESWSLATVNQITSLVKDGPHYSPKYEQSGVPFISGGSIRPEGVDFKNVKYISNELHEELSKRCKPELNDILYTKGGTTGIARVNTYSRDFNVWVHVAVLRLVDTACLEPFYIQHALNSMLCYYQSQIYTHGVGNQDLGLTRMIKIVFALPPTDEQKEIVKRIEELFKLADNIEDRYNEARARVEQLTPSILVKAFRGDLVPQDPKDEPASILLKRIKAEREEQEDVKKKVKSIRKLKVKVIKMNKDSVIEVIGQLPNSSFSFEELQKETSGDYEELKDVIFSLLDDGEVIKQIFDKENKEICFQRN